MTVQEYQTIIEKTAIFPKKQVGLAYCGLGLTGEAGEVADKIKKLYRDEDFGSYENFKDFEFVDKKAAREIKENLVKELGDVLWYLSATANELGVSLEYIMQQNYDKLIKRRETNTLHGSGDNREDQ